MGRIIRIRKGEAREMSDNKARHFGEKSAVAIRSTGSFPRKLRRKIRIKENKRKTREKHINA